MTVQTLGGSVLKDVPVLHQEELLDDARAVLEEEFSIAIRASAEASMDALKVDVLDVIHALKTSDKLTMNYAQWPCADYHGVSHDGERLVVVAVIHKQEKIVKIIKVWKG